MKRHVYFREDTQELRLLPINEENCYYLGELTNTEIKNIQKYLSHITISFADLVLRVNAKVFK